MARPADRFVSKLSEKQRATLLETWKHSPSHRARTRAHAILLSSRGHSVASIANIFEVTVETVYNWLDRWENHQALDDAPRSGAPPKLDEDDQRKALEELKRTPRQPQRVIERIQQRTGTEVSREWLRRLAQKFGFSWKRAQPSLKDRRDQEAFDLAKEDLQELAEQHGREDDDLHLWYFDESHFNMQGESPYAWQPIGETVKIPAVRGGSVSRMGFVDPDGNFQSYEVEGTVNTKEVIKVLDDFSQRSSGFNVVVLDNASVHTSKAFQEARARWEERSLYLYYLPPYSPELNLIEIVWREIKQRWLPLRAHTSFKRFVEEPDQILKSIGDRYQINFPSMQF